MITLISCPVCSVLMRGNLTRSTTSGYLRTPVIMWGRRSQKFFLNRPLGCNHGPVTEAAKDTEAEISGPWNEWAKATAESEATRRGFTSDDRAWWLYHLGCGPHPVFRK